MKGLIEKSMGPLICVLGRRATLPSVTAATDDEPLHFIEQRRLMGRGIGYVDVHLLTATGVHFGALAL
jgi:hypothetical protein